MDYKECIIKYCYEIGLSQIGFTKCRVFHELKEFLTKRKHENIENEFEEKDIEKRINPFLYMKEGKTIISLAFPYMHETSTKADKYFSKYTLGRDYHEVVSKYLESICNFIKSLNGKAIYFVDNNALPERYIAYLSGIGFIGKNNMVITERYGSYIFLGEIITDLEIEEDMPKESKCGNCDICIKACPGRSISEKGYNPNICLSYITQKKNINEEEISKLKGKIFGCDICQDVCPYNKHIEFSKINEFEPFDFMRNTNFQEILNMSKKDFNEKYKMTSCGWRGKSVLQRNALINLAHMKRLKEGKKFNSPYVEEYYNKLLKNSKF